MSDLSHEEVTTKLAEETSREESLNNEITDLNAEIVAIDNNINTIQMKSAVVLV